jgi:cbb3-type cytochrome oxidase subunit 3
MMDFLEALINPLKIGLTVVMIAVFLAIVRWALLRPQEQIEADAHLWKDD